MLVVVATLALVPASVAAQEYGFVLGAGGTSWSGAGSDDWSARVGLTSGAFTVTKCLVGGWAGRLEIGGRGLSADLGNTGLFDQETRVTLNRVLLRGLVRRTLSESDGGMRVFAEAGLAGWGTTACDVDMEGGPGFLGGETESCSDWFVEDGPGPLIDKGSGGSWMLGGGIRLDRWGFGLRYERDFADAIGSPTGSVLPATLEFTGEWFLPWGDLSRRGADGDPGAGASGPIARAPDPAPNRTVRAADAVLAGALEFGIPFLGFAYAGAWSDWEAFMSNATRVAGVMVLMTGQGDGDAITGAVLLSAGTAWAVAGAARHAKNRRRA